MGQARRKLIAANISNLGNPKLIDIVLTEAQKAANSALEEISQRSFAGRNLHLGRMVNCQVCGFRHRKNERNCEQKFAKDKYGNVYGELKIPEHLTEFTQKQIYGATAFTKKRLRPHSNRYPQARINSIAAKQRKAQLVREEKETEKR